MWLNSFRTSESLTEIMHSVCMKHDHIIDRHLSMERNKCDFSQSLYVLLLEKFIFAHDSRRCERASEWVCVSMRTRGAAQHTHNLPAAAGAINFCALARIQAIILYFPLSTQNNNKAKILLVFSFSSKQHFVSLLCAVARLTFYDCFCARAGIACLAVKLQTAVAKIKDARAQQLSYDVFVCNKEREKTLSLCVALTAMGDEWFC